MSCSELIEIQHTNIRQPFSTWYCNNFKPMAGCPCWYRACRTLCTQSLWKGTCLDDSSSSLPLSLRQLRAKSRTEKPLELQGKEKRWNAASSRKVLFVCAGLRSWTASKRLHWLCAPKGILIYCVEGFITKDHHLSEAEIVKQKRSKRVKLIQKLQNPKVQCIGISLLQVAAKALHQRHPRLEVFQRTRSMHIWLPGPEWLMDGAPDSPWNTKVAKWCLAMGHSLRAGTQKDEVRKKTEPRMLGPGKKNLSSERFFQEVIP